MKRIPLTQDKFALVDDSDFDYLNQFKWCAHWNGRHWYAIRRTQGKLIGMHRFIIGGTSRDIDHKNGDCLDNRRFNLRPASRGENNANGSKKGNNSSGFTGVSWEKRRNHWRAYITKDGKPKHLGSFATAQEASLAYNSALQNLFGEFARVK